MNKPEKTNYDLFSESASQRFLTFDQEEILKKFSLPADEKSIFIRFLDRKYRIDRSTGYVYLQPGRGASGIDHETGAGDETEAGDETGAGDAREIRAGANVTLSVFDMLCRSENAPHMSGEWVSLSDMTAKTGYGPTNTSLFGKKMACFEGKSDRLARACEKMGGVKKEVGDVSYELPVFDGLSTWFQFWDADDEFPSSIRFLWDRTTTRHLHYETLWYIMQEILDRLCALDREDDGPAVRTGL